MLAVLGVLCIVFGLIDFAGMFLGYDLTGVSWSPIVAGVVGGALIQAGGGDEEAEEDPHQYVDHDDEIEELMDPDESDDDMDDADEDDADEDDADEDDADEDDADDDDDDDDV